MMPCLDVGRVSFPVSLSSAGPITVHSNAAHANSSPELPGKIVDPQTSLRRQWTELVQLIGHVFVKILLLDFRLQHHQDKSMNAE